MVLLLLLLEFLMLHWGIMVLIVSDLDLGTTSTAEVVMKSLQAGLPPLV